MSVLARFWRLRRLGGRKKASSRIETGVPRRAVILFVSWMKAAHGTGMTEGEKRALKPGFPELVS